MRSLDEIRAIVSRAAPAHTLLLNDGFLTEIGIDPFWEDTLRGVTLTFNNLHEVGEEGEALIYSASANFLNRNLQDIRIAFLAQDNRNDLVVEMPLGEWKFSDSFPNLPVSLNYSQGMPFPQSSFLDELVLEQPKLLIASKQYENKVRQIRAVRGLSFCSIMKLEGPYEEVGFFARERAVLLNGALLLDEGSYNAELNADVVYELALGSTKLNDVALVIDSSLDRDRSDQGYFSIHAKFRFDGRVVDISTQLVLGGADIMVINGALEPSQLHLPSLANLASLVGGDDLNALLPEFLQGDANLSLTEINLALMPSTQDIIFLGLAITSNREWTLIDSPRVTLKDIKTHFLISSPFASNSSDREIELYLSGVIHFGGAGGAILNVKVGVPSLLFICNLDKTTSIDLRYVFSQFGLDLSDIGISELECTDFDLTIDNRNKFFKFFADVEGDWLIPIGAKEVRLTELEFEYDRSRESSNLIAQGYWSIGSTVLYVSGQRQSGLGWDFEGRLGSGEVNLTELVNELANLFDVTMPSGIPDIVISELKVQFNTRSKSFHFLIYTDISRNMNIGGIETELDLKLNLTSVKRPSDGKRVLSGFFEADLLAGDHTFTAMLSLDENSKLIEAIWRSHNGETVGLTDIAELIGIQDANRIIPSDLSLELDELRLAYETQQQLFTLSGSAAEYGDAFISAGKDSNGKFALVFGVNVDGINKLSDLPVVGSDLQAADFINAERAAFMVSTGQFTSYEIPILPPLNVDAYYVPSTELETGISKVKPIASGSVMQLEAGQLSLAAVVDMTAAQSQEMQNLNSLVKQDSLVLQCGFSPSGAQLFMGLNGSVSIPTGEGEYLKLNEVGVRIELARQPLFALQGGFDFSINGAAIEATAIMSIDPTKANVMVNVASGDGTFPPPPGLKGLHIVSFGMLMGVSFVPTGLNIGLQGRFQIGQIQARDNEFGLVLQIINGVPIPLYMSFYLDTLSMSQAVTLFTDTRSAGMDTLDIIEATECSMYWCQNSILLPDGTLAEPGFGFSCTLRVADFGLHGSFQVGVQSGIHGRAESSPVDLKGILKLAGGGQGIERVFVQDNGVWRQTSNKQLTAQEASLPSRKQMMIQPGGPVFEISSSGPTFVNIHLQVSLFDIVELSVVGILDVKQVVFVLTYNVAGIQQFDLTCRMQDWSNFSASAGFTFGLNQSFGPIKVGEIDIGSIHINTFFSGQLSVTINDDGFLMVIDGSFKPPELPLVTLPKLEISVAPSSLATMVSDVTGQIERNAQNLFGDLVKEAGRYAELVGKGIVTGVESIGAVLKDAYDIVDPEEAAKILQVAGYGATEIGHALSDGYNLAAEEVANTLEAVGYTAETIADALGTLFSGIHVDITSPPPHIDNRLHLDTPAGPHADTHTPPRVSTRQHIDTPGGPHVDTHTPPRVSSRNHVDTPGGPHIDSRTPHADTDSFLGHIDTGGGHADSQVPPHGDTSVHVDTPAGPHSDTRVPPRVNETTHIDTPAGPHADSRVPPHADTTEHVDTPSGPHIDTN